MPGILTHEAFAELFRTQLRKELLLRLMRFDFRSAQVLFHFLHNLNQTDFFSGNQIPDLATDKKASHYRIPASVDGFVVPDLEKVKNVLFYPEHSIKFGCYTHLWLDYHFIEGLLIPSFEWDLERQKVRNPRNGKTWTKDEFFSPDSLYGAYTEMNHLMIRDEHISLRLLNRLPDVLPATGIPIFDCRREQTWREELNKYLAENRPYTGEVFEYSYFISCLENLAQKFTQEILEELEVA